MNFDALEHTAITMIVSVLKLYFRMYSEVDQYQSQGGDGSIPLRETKSDQYNRCSYWMYVWA